MGEPEQDRRSSTRSEVSLSAVVKGRESAEEYWKEETRIVTISRLGASFNLERECSVGRIVLLTTQMPNSLRTYDRDKKLYSVWGLVQHCSPVPGSEGSNFQVGIAFIGKYAPDSYAEDPQKTYRIVGMDEYGFWTTGENSTPFFPRAHHRYPCRMEVRLALLDSEGNEVEHDDNSITDNISLSGALVFSDLEVTTGDAVRFSCDEFDYSALAVVRNRQQRDGNRTTLHLEFTDANFPVEEIDLPGSDEAEIENADELSVLGGENAGLSSQSDEASRGLDSDTEEDPVDIGGNASKSEEE